MNRSTIKAVSSIAVVSLILSASLPFTKVKAAVGQVTELSGADCYETAAVVAEKNWTTSTDVVLASGEGYADAISSTAISKQLKAPILLTKSNSLNSYAKSALEQLNPENIYIIGGTASISQSIRDELKNDGYNLIELGGKNRYETNLKVAQQLVKLGVDTGNMMLVSGEGFADSLSAAPIAAAKGQILLLGVNNTETMKSIVDFVKSNNSEVTVLSTENLINSEIYNELGAVSRISGGDNRFDTNLNILNQYDSDLKADKLYIANVSGDRYTDALIAASVAGINSSPLVLIGEDDDTSTSNALNYIRDKVTETTDLNLIEEEGVVSENTISDINAAASGSSVESATVASVTTNGLNQIKVVFNTDVDEDSAERAANYEISGSYLGSVSETQATATLQEDNRTVLITFSNAFQQNKEVTFTVKNAINTKDSTTVIDKYEKKITFSSVTVPTLDSVTAVGGNKLVVKFSEPIRMTDDELSSFKINRQNVTAFGLNTSDTEFRDQSLNGKWADGVELYFNSPLPIGTNTFTVPNGESGVKFDNAAGFPLSSTSKNFTVNYISGSPQVESVTSENSDTVYIEYNRPMDQQTALEPTNYKINDTTVNVDSSYVTFDKGSEDTIVKITKLENVLKSGSNTITISEDIEDTFGNYVTKTNMNFYVGGDTDKPTITSASIFDEETIRVKFNKDITRSYATDKGNYTILDSSGADITYKIDDIYAVTVDGNSKRTFNIKFEDGTLNGSKYTLKVENIIDTNAVPNIMDPYTVTLEGTDTEGVSVDEILRRSDNSHAVAMSFTKVMDPSSLESSSNYLFRDGNGDIRTLPTSAVITGSLDYKSVTIEFPSSFTIGTGSGGTSVYEMGVKNVKDASGNPLDLGSYMGQITIDSSDGPKIVSDTAKMTFEDNDIEVKVSLSSPLDILSLSDFKVAGNAPDSGYCSGNDVILMFKAGIKNNEKIDDIKDSGSSATVSVTNTNSVDWAGRNIRSGSTKVYIPPMTRSDLWSAEGSNGNTVTIVFNQDIDNDIKTSYKDDFIFKDSDGEELSPTGVTIDGRKVIYRFNNGTFEEGDKIYIYANSDSSEINVRSEKHDDSGYTLYVPSSEDLDGRTITAD
ncbi:cell wall-binding repeat-containing protein [Clostridium kluyveri]|uniref:Cell surface protein n=1 Tax=Clostridium kluyveri TaxID=1534 RepID=A0A1L5FBD7_CLOKL|nr:cell wall-binding repeat-containing protein [Clostridium kluyveri]APM40319.1 cell surface protein [Clostridium kluyveri]